MYFSSTVLVAILPSLSIAHLCAHHAAQPQLLVVESPNRVPTYEAPQIEADTPNHVHVVTRTITRTTQATTTITSTTLPPLLSPSSISFYQTSSSTSSTSSESLGFHQDLKIKRNEPPAPLFTGHGPVQPGLAFNIQGKSMTLLSGTLVPATETVTSSLPEKTVNASALGSKAASASASKPTSTSGAGVVGVGMGSFGVWGATMFLAGLL